MTKKFPLSFSRLSTFENCQQQFDYLYVTKSVQDQGNEHTFYGNRVHEALENYAKTGDESHLTLETRGFKKYVDRIVSKPGEKFYEYQMAINSERQPCDWFDSDVWVRSIADVLIVNGETAYCLDWKTGKPKDNPSQLQLFSCMIFIHFPQVQEVRTSFIWLNHEEVTGAKYPRSMFDLLWQGLSRRFDVVQETVETGVFKARPSGLCKWCAAKRICSYAK